jgi:hypothetical protein
MGESKSCDRHPQETVASIASYPPQSPVTTDPIVRRRSSQQKNYLELESYCRFGG